MKTEIILCPVCDEKVFVVQGIINKHLKLGNGEEKIVRCPECDHEVEVEQLVLCDGSDRFMSDNYPRVDLHATKNQ